MACVEMMAYQDYQVEMARKEIVVMLAYQDSQVLQAEMDYLDGSACQDHLHPTINAFIHRQESPENLGGPEKRAILENLEIKACLVHQAQLDFLELLE